MTNKKPIRKDRVLIALLVLVAVILIPILISSGGKKAPTNTVSTPQTSTESDSLPVVSLTPPSDEATTDTSPSTDTTSETPAVSTTTEPTTVSEPADSSGIITHVVTSGESLEDIASQMGVTTDELLADNGLVSASEVIAGRTMYAAAGGLVHVIKRGQTLTDISITYGVSVEKIAQENGISDPGKINAGQRIVIPGANTNLWKTVIRLSHGQESRFIWPLEGEVTSPFGWRIHPVFGTKQHHNGIDIDVPEGTIVHAAAPGTVHQIYNDPEGYGTALVLEHADGYLTVYGHLSSVLVSVGQYVEVGQPVAESGNTGVSTGPHLHFEVRHGEFPIDPQRYLPS